MSLTLQSNFTTQPNLVLPLAQNTSGLAVRLVSQGSGTMGTLTATGAQGTPTFTLNNAPSFVTLGVDPTNTVATLQFVGATYQPDPYGFYVSCTDGNSTVNFPIFLEIRQPFSLLASTPSLASGATPVITSQSPLTLNIPSYDSTVADVEIQGIGLYNAVQSNVSFILPSSLPEGMSFVTSDRTKLVLRVAPATYSDMSGGLKTFENAPTAQSVTIYAYQPNSFYDSPSNLFVLNLSVGSQSAKVGTLDIGVGAYYDTVSELLHADAQVDVLMGALKSSGAVIDPSTFTYTWTASGTAVVTPNGGTTSRSATYQILSPGSLTLALTVSANGVTIANGSQTVTFNQVAQSGGASWLATNAIKVGVSGDRVQGYSGDTVSFVVSSPEFNTGETLTFTTTVSAEMGGASVGGALVPPAVLSSNTFTLNATTVSQAVNVQIPSVAPIGCKWVVGLTASNGATRRGYAQVLIECSGAAPLAVTVPVALSSSTGTAITPIQLTATNGDPLSPSYGLAVPSATFELQGAPDGFYINSQNQLVGNATTPGTYTFIVTANATGYARGYSNTITVTVSRGLAPLTITGFVPSVTSIQNNTSFNLTWGTSGNATDLYLLQTPAPTPIRDVTGATSTSVQQVGSDVYCLYGDSYYGTAYSVPVVVLSSSIGTAQALLPSPTIALIDDSNQLTVNWQPYAVSGDYTVYKGWDITINQLAVGAVASQSETLLTDGLSLGTVSAREFQEALTVVADYTLDMQALSNNYMLALDSTSWDTPHQFPAVFSSANVIFDNTTLLLGQPMTITLQNSYSGADADSWQVVYPDNTSTGWLPLSTTATVKIFNTPGTFDVIIQTQKDYGTNNPPVKLRRQLTQQVLVMNQQYNSQSSIDDDLTGTLGVAGTQGFEIINVTGGATTQPYEVVVRAIARDTITNELKLMVATSRYSNASSLLGTMAIDVFPIGGRPHAPEFIAPVFVLETTNSTSSVPVAIQNNDQTLPLPSSPSVIAVGKPMSTEFKMTAAGGNTPYSWFAQGLPPGLVMSTDGTISGTPTSLGTFSTTFSVMDSSTPAYIDEATLTFAIPTDLVITTTSVPAAQVGVPYSTPITNTGGLAPYSWNIAAGQVPVGLSIDTLQGTLGGTPCTYNSTTDFKKTYTFTVQVTDAIGSCASKTYNTTLNPMPLQFGALDQPSIVAQEDFTLSVPVFGGQSPYTFVSFADSGIVGTGLQIVNPSQVSVIGKPIVSLTLNTNVNQTVYPAAGGTMTVVIPLSASGGIQSTAGLPNDVCYKFLVDPTAANTLPGAVCYGSLLVAYPTANGTYTVTVKVVDMVGHTASQTLNVTVVQQGTGEYTLQACTINLNGSESTPSNWIVTPLSGGLPDPKLGTVYAPSPGQYYAIVLFDNGVAKLNSGTNPAMTFSIVDGALPNGLSQTSASSAFSAAADGVILIQGTPLTLGTAQFDVNIQGITNSSSQLVSAGQSFTQDVTNAGGGTTPVVAITSIAEMDIDLSMVTANSINGLYSWAHPLTAAGGTAPYTFSIVSGTTLPGSAIISANGAPSLVSNTGQVSNYIAAIQATDANGTQSKIVQITVRIVESATQPIHILSSNPPQYLYVNQAIPVNSYSVTSDLIATWTATGLPTGMSLSTTIGNQVYLIGTPTTAGQVATVTITATSVVFGTTTSTSFILTTRPQAVAILTLVGGNWQAATSTTATIGSEYRGVSNSALIQVQYTGFQPGAANLPLLQNDSSKAFLGSPTGANSSFNGQPTTSVTGVTFDGFFMTYDYIPNSLDASGTLDTLTFNNVAYPNSLVIKEVPSQLVATALPTTQNISEYTVEANLSLPVQISGGAAPYSIKVSSVSDSRFQPVDANGDVVSGTTPCTGLQISVSQFTAGSSYSCLVSMMVSDSSNQTVSVSGTVTVFITLETSITVDFYDLTWAISLSAPVQSGSVVLNESMSVPIVGHSPYQFYVDSVTIPVTCTAIKASPSDRVLAFNLTSASISVPDVSSTLTSNGTFPVASTTSVVPNTYVIPVTLRVVDSKGITSTSNRTVNVTISA